MSNVAALVGMVCVCAVAVSALSVVSPNGMTSKTLNMVIGIFMVCVMIIPIKNFFVDLNLNINLPEIPESVSSDAQQAYNNAVIAETKSRLEKTLLTLMSEKGYNVSSVNVKLDENNDGGIYISGINIYISKAEKRISGIIQDTKNKFDVTPRIIQRQ